MSEKRTDLEGLEMVERAAMAIRSCVLVKDVTDDQRRWDWERIGQSAREMYLGEARAAIDSLACWQPIETAPKDAWILVLDTQKVRPWRIAWWSEYQFKKFGNGWAFDGNGFISPTHWMPLPTPPEAA